MKDQKELIKEIKESVELKLKQHPNHIHFDPNWQEEEVIDTAIKETMNKIGEIVISIIREGIKK